MRNNTSWLQHIPKHWEVKRMKDIFLESDEITETGKEDLLSVSEYYGVARRKDKMTEDEVYETRADSLIGYKVCHRGDLVSNIMLTWKRALGISNYDGIVSPAYAVYKGLGINSGYYHYLLRSDMYIAEFKRQSKGIIESRLRLYTDRFYNIPAIHPPLSEQEKIARYLDTKVGEIDQKVSLIEKKIERYQLLKKSIINKVVTKGLHPKAPLKDSQISWLGQIPAHWEEKRLKDLGYFYGGLSGKSGEDFQNEDEDVIKPFIPYTNILNNFYVNPEVVKYVVINDNESQNTIQKGDLLFLMSSEDYESIAKASVVNEEVDELYLNSFCKGMRITNKQIYSPFLCYLLSNNDCRDSLRFEAQGFTRINIKTGKVACASIIIPPLSEQQEIASYLDQKCADIDAIIANCTAQIEKYKTLKRALINEVVTGQRTIE